MAYTTEQKLEFECQKLQQEIEKLTEEVKNIKRPFIRQPTTIFGAIPLLISIALNLQQCSKTKNAEDLAKIEFARTSLKTEQIRRDNDSLEKRKTELGVNIALAKSQLQTVVDSVNEMNRHITELAGQLASSTTSTPQAKETIADIQQTANNINQVGKYAVANIDMKNNSFKVSTFKNEPLARLKWKEGFDALVNNDMEKAIAAFTASENAWNGYHNAYELARYLRSKANIASDPSVRKEIIYKVLNDYSGFAPKESIAALKKESGS